MTTIDAEKVILYVAMLRAFIAGTHFITATLIVVLSGLLDRSYLRGIFEIPFKVRTLQINGCNADFLHCQLFSLHFQLKNQN